MKTPTTETTGEIVIEAIERTLSGYSCLIEPKIGLEILESAKEEMALAVGENNIDEVRRILKDRQNQIITLGSECREAQLSQQAEQNQ